MPPVTTNWLRRWWAAGMGLLVVLFGATTLVPLFTAAAVDGAQGDTVTVMGHPMTVSGFNAGGSSLVSSVTFLSIQDVQRIRGGVKTDGAIRLLKVELSIPVFVLDEVLTLGECWGRGTVAWNRINAHELARVAW